MIDVNLLNLFEACSRMPSRSRSPLAVHTGIGFGFISNCLRDDLGTQRTRTSPRRSVHLTSHCASPTSTHSSNRSLTYPAPEALPIVKVPRYHRRAS